MALYFSSRALDESTGLTEDKLSLWKFADSEAVTIGAKVGANSTPIASENSSESTSTRSIERTAADDDRIAILRSRIDFRDVFEDDLRIGEFVQVDSDNFQHGCFPVLTLGKIRKKELTAYLGEGQAVTPAQPWWRRLWTKLGFGMREHRSVDLQVFGSADNYSRWNPTDRSSLVREGEWFPSSPEGMGLILGPEAGIPDSDVCDEIEKDNGDASSPAFLCDRFDHLADGLFHNSHRGAGVVRKLSHGPQIDSQVRIWGRVYGVREDQHGPDSLVQKRTVLIRPIMIVGTG